MTTVCLPVFWPMTTVFLPVFWPMTTVCLPVCWSSCLHFVYLCWPHDISKWGIILWLKYSISTSVLAHEDVCQCAGLKSTAPMTMCSWLCLLYTCGLAHDHSMSTCVITSMSTCVVAYDFVYFCAGPCLCLPASMPMIKSTCLLGYDNVYL